MKETKILSWNVNGIRAAVKNGLLDWLDKESPDILCVQETKAHPEQLDDSLKKPPGYRVYWNQPERKGYSGVATFTRKKPLRVEYDLGVKRLDAEGRVIITAYPGFTLFNVYFPNGKKDETRLKYKMDFYEDFLKFLEPLRQKGERLIICGDFNTAHQEIDLARPKENEKVSGFLPVEREWMDKFVSRGYTDTFRYFNKEKNQYTWWDLKSRARERNVGWRIDYFFITRNLLEVILKAFIIPEVTGSDHCPVGITLRATGTKNRE
ncbi:MAG: exodeoxyribonuclease III [Dehalococcoidales bacterium]|nr:exodeoxyribonuclease III [Dehalococcoidales bacterium]